MTLDYVLSWSRTRRLICHSTAAATAILIAILAILVVDRRPVIHVYDTDITPNPAMAGETAVITWRARELRACDGQVVRIIIDSARVEHQFAPEPTVAHYELANGIKQFSKEFTIPRSANPGPAIYFARIKRWCNPLQRYVWPMNEVTPRARFVIGTRAQATPRLSGPYTSSTGRKKKRAPSKR